MRAKYHTSSRCASRIRMRQWDADSRAHALVANPTSGIPVLLANGGGVFKMLGYTLGDSLAENRAIMNKQVSSYS